MSASYHPTMTCEQLQEKIQQMSSEIDCIAERMSDMENRYEVVEKYTNLMHKSATIRCDMYNLISYLPK